MVETTCKTIIQKRTFIVSFAINTKPPNTVIVKHTAQIIDNKSENSESYLHKRRKEEKKKS